MNRNLLVDALASRATFLVKIDQPAAVTENGETRRQRIRGELLVTANQPLGATSVHVKLYRFGLHSIDTPDTALTGEISVSGYSGAGVLEPVEHSPDLWRLNMHMNASVTYSQIAATDSLPIEPDYVIGPSEDHTVAIGATVAVNRDEELESRLTITSGTLQAKRIPSTGGSLRSIELDLHGHRVIPLSATANPTLVIPLQPVQFPVGGKWTGTSLDDQLERANHIWRPCAIQFCAEEFYPINDPAVGSSENPAEILKSYHREGAIEVFFVLSKKLNGHTYPAGTAIAGVVISESPAPDASLLAHELAHVLSACHPQYDDCAPHLWRGADDTVCDPKPPISDTNSPRNCAKARRSGQALLKTRL